MIKIDFHIHTMPVAPWDSNFTFSMDKLDSYVKENNLNCIAITNHNKFFRKQFEDISNHHSSITVLPEIEIHVLNGMFL